MGEVSIEELNAAKTISGPFELFKKSFVLEFVEPPALLDATVLMRCTYISPSENALCAMGKKHPQSPPLHIHFDQSESFLVVTGEVCTTETYGAKDCTWTAKDGVRCVPPYLPHNFWPSATATEDTIIYVWAHPTAVQEPMDRLFFQTLLRYISDTYERNVSPNIVQIMVTQQASATALVMFPTAWWLGALRWWVPWTLQRGIAAVGRMCGYRALMREYTTEEEWASYLHAKRA